MDEENYQAVAALCRESGVEIRPFLDYASERLESKGPDPFYGKPGGFKHVLDLVKEASEGLLEDIWRQQLQDGRASLRRSSQRASRSLWVSVSSTRDRWAEGV